MDFPKNIKTVLQQARDAKQPYERVWDLCENYLKGRQYVEYDSHLARYRSMQALTGRNRIVINKLLNIYRQITARLAVVYPSPTVMPPSPSNEDIVKAQVSELAAQYFWQEQDLEAKFARLVRLLAEYGTAASYTFFNPEKKKVEVKIYSARDLFFESGAITDDESAFKAVRTWTRRSEVERCYPALADEIRRLPAQQRDDTSAKKSHEFQDPRVELFNVYWQDGRCAVVVENLYLHQGETPGRAMPIHVARYTPWEDEVWGLGMIEPAVDLQNAYNRQRGQILDNIDLMGNPAWLVHQSAKLNAEGIRGVPGEIVRWSGSGPEPKQQSPAPLPAYLLDSVRQTDAEILDVLGMHSVSLGKRAVGLTSGAALETLTKQDVSQLQVTTGELDKLAKGILTVALQLMQLYYTESRFMRMFDSGGKLVYRELRNTELVDTPEVIIETGAMFRDQREDRDQRTINRLKLGLLTPEQAQKALIEKVDTRTSLNHIQSLNHVQELLEAVKLGGAIEVFASDDLKTFKDVFGEFIQSNDEFYALPFDRQEYIRDVYIAVVAPPEGPNPTGLVFPRPPPIEGAQTVSPVAAPSATPGSNGARSPKSTMSSAAARGYYTAVGAERATQLPPSTEQDLDFNPVTREGGEF